MERINDLPPNTTGIPGVFTVNDFKDRILEDYERGTPLKNAQIPAVLPPGDTI